MSSRSGRSRTPSPMSISPPRAPRRQSPPRWLALPGALRCPPNARGTNDGSLFEGELIGTHAGSEREGARWSPAQDGSRHHASAHQCDRKTHGEAFEDRYYFLIDSAALPRPGAGSTFPPRLLDPAARVQRRDLDLVRHHGLRTSTAWRTGVPKPHGDNFTVSGRIAGQSSFSQGFASPGPPGLPPLIESGVSSGDSRRPSGCARPEPPPPGNQGAASLDCRACADAPRPPSSCATPHAARARSSRRLRALGAGPSACLTECPLGTRQIVPDDDEDHPARRALDSPRRRGRRLRYQRRAVQRAVGDHREHHRRARLRQGQRSLQGGRGPEDFERRVNEIYQGSEVISVAVQDLDAKTQVVTGFFDKNSDGSVQDPEKVFSIRRDVSSEAPRRSRRPGSAPTGTTTRR